MDLKNKLINDYFDTQIHKEDFCGLETHKKDWLDKKSAAEGLVVDFKKRVGPLNDKKMLDVGFGNGLIAEAFSKEGSFMYGVEIDEKLVSIAKEITKSENQKIDFRIYDGKNLPFEDSYFDYVFSTSVLEHITYKKEILKEVSRVLKPGGKFYLAFPNRFTPIETHSKLFGIGYMPRSLARKYLKIRGRNTIDDWNLYFLSYFWLKRTLKKNNIKLNILYETDSKSFLKKLFKKTLALFGIHHSAILSHVMVILVKP